jgi:hypothetical protein
MMKSHDRTLMTQIERIYADFNLPVIICANPPESDLIRVPLPLIFVTIQHTQATIRNPTCPPLN